MNEATTPDMSASQQTDKTPHTREPHSDRSKRDASTEKTGQMPKIGKKKTAETVSRPPRDDDDDSRYRSPLLRAYQGMNDTDSDQNDWANFMPFPGRLPPGPMFPWGYFVPPHMSQDDPEDHDDGDDDWGADPEVRLVESEDVNRDADPSENENTPQAVSDTVLSGCLP